MPAKSKDFSNRRNSTTFKKGMTPWNKTNLYKQCEQCNKDFKVTQAQLKSRPCRFCSKNCHSEYMKKDYTRDTKAMKCYKLALEGKTIREISETTGYPAGSVASYLNKMKYRRYTNGGQSYTSVKNRLLKLDDYKQCCICKFKRIIEVAHIIPAAKGGDLTEQNTLPLCPNHHHLFDTKKLTKKEKLKIENFIGKRNAQ